MFLFDNVSPLQRIKYMTMLSKGMSDYSGSENPLVRLKAVKAVNEAIRLLGGTFVKVEQENGVIANTSNNSDSQYNSKDKEYLQSIIDKKDDFNGDNDMIDKTISELKQISSRNAIGSILYGMLDQAVTLYGNWLKSKANKVILTYA